VPNERKRCGMTARNDHIDLSHAQWRKSTRSTAEAANCVEVAAVQRAVAVRDSKNPDGPKLIFDRRSWRRFTQAVKRGSYEM
jgi:hypothetical protein